MERELQVQEDNLELLKEENRAEIDTITIVLGDAIQKLREEKELEED